MGAQPGVLRSAIRGCLAAAGRGLIHLLLPELLPLRLLLPLLLPLLVLLHEGREARRPGLQLRGLRREHLLRRRDKLLRRGRQRRQAREHLLRRRDKLLQRGHRRRQARPSPRHLRASGHGSGP